MASAGHSSKKFSFGSCDDSGEWWVRMDTYIHTVSGLWGCITFRTGTLDDGKVFVRVDVDKRERALFVVKPKWENGWTRCSCVCELRIRKNWRRPSNHIGKHNMHIYCKWKTNSTCFFRTGHANTCPHPLCPPTSLEFMSWWWDVKMNKCMMMGVQSQRKEQRETILLKSTCEMQAIWIVCHFVA